MYSIYKTLFKVFDVEINSRHYSDVIMSTMASQITRVSICYSSVCSGADQRKHKSSASLAFVRGSHRRPVAQRASNAENVTIWWRHHGKPLSVLLAPCEGMSRSQRDTINAGLWFFLGGWFELFRKQSSTWRHCNGTNLCSLVRKVHLKVALRILNQLEH